MFYKELKKIIFNVPALIIVLMALISSLLFTYVTIHRYSDENEKTDKYYKEYMKELQGEVTKEKGDYIQRQKTFIDEVIEQEEAMLSKYNNNEIDSKKYQQYLDDNFYATEHSASIEKVNEQYQSLLDLEKKGTEGHLIYDTYWNMYFDMSAVTLIQILAVIALIIRYFSEDFSSGMWKMTQTYYNGKSRLFHTRLGLTTLSCAGISVLFTMMYYIFFKTRFYMPDMKAPIQSLCMFHDFPLQMTMTQFLILISVFRLLALCLFGIFVFLVVSIVHNIMASFGICGFVVLIPMIFSVSSKIFLKISFYEVVFGIGLMKRSATFMGLIQTPVLFIVLIFILYAVALFKQSDKMWRL